MKLETVPTAAQTTTFVPLDGTVMVSATPMPTLSLAPPPPQASAAGSLNVTSGGPPTAMMMYPGLYNHSTTVFAVAPETTSIVGSTFQPDNGTTLPVAINSSNAAIANTSAPTGSIVVVRPTATQTATKETPKSIISVAPVVTISSAATSTTNKAPDLTVESSTNVDVCCRCQQKSGDDAFLVCQDCGLKGKYFVIFESGQVHRSFNKSCSNNELIALSR